MKLVWINIILLFAVSSFAQNPNSWDPGVDFGAGQRDRAVSFGLLDKGYVACGQDTADNIHNDLWEFDAATQMWSQMASLPGSGRRNAVAFTIGDFAYVGTGVDNASAPLGNILNDFWKYDPLINSWTSIANYPGAWGIGVYFATAFTGVDKGYVCGGKYGPDSYVDELWEYKASSDLWVQRASFPGGIRYHMISYSVNGRAFMGLGANEDVYLKDWWEYNAGTNVWTQRTDFPASERGDCISFVLRNRGFVGLGTDGGYKQDIWEYNHNSDTWITRNDFPALGRKFACAFVIADTAYVGTGNSPTGRKRSFYEYYRGSIMDITEEEQTLFTAYPNPVRYNFTLSEVATDFSHVSVINMNGKTMKTFARSSNGQYQIDNSLASGIYLLALFNQTEMLGYQKILIER
ncbi:MAG: T9SS type A sorting domain-containing protein [Flavobacteriales bacterium]|nr:T9SS type A sorting domain-containing protein [Flavobacteriales bacterium]